MALELARQTAGEIITVDSMQVYRGLDIGTAKPSEADRAAHAHHLLDCSAVENPFDAAAFVRLAKMAQADITARGKRPIYCGGTGFYFTALLEGLGDAPGPDRALRAQLEETDTPSLLEELQRGDPATLARIDRQNRRRLIRAVEVLRLTCRAPSTQRAVWGAGAHKNFFVLSRKRDDLRARVDARVEAMFAAGLIEETRALAPQLGANPAAAQAVGYRQVLEHLRGERDLPGTMTAVKLATWRLVRRQTTWWRKYHPAPWLFVPAGESPGESARRVLEQVE